MTASAGRGHVITGREAAHAPRFRGLFRRLSGATTSLTLPLAGKGWNPIFAVVEHRGRKSGRSYATPVAARRIDGGFVISLAFGAQADWYLNMLAAGGGAIRWHGEAYPISTPERVDPETGLAAFHPIQRGMLRLAGIDGYIQVADAGTLAANA